MPRWARELPDYADAYKHTTSITMNEAARLRNDMKRLSNQRLAVIYLEIPTAHKTSVFAEFMEEEIVDRWCEREAKIPKLKVDL